MDILKLNFACHDEYHLYLAIKISREKNEAYMVIIHVITTVLHNKLNLEVRTNYETIIQVFWVQKIGRVLESQVGGGVKLSKTLSMWNVVNL